MTMSMLIILSNMRINWKFQSIFKLKWYYILNLGIKILISGYIQWLK